MATLGSLLYLQAPQRRHQEVSSEPSCSSQNAIVDVREIPTRLPAHGRTAERILAIMALVGASIGGAGLILLSGFDTWRYHTLHHIFLAVFMFGVALSALFTMAQVSSRYVCVPGAGHPRVRLIAPLNSSRFSPTRIGTENQMISGLLGGLLSSKGWQFLS